MKSSGSGPSSGSAMTARAEARGEEVRGEHGHFVTHKIVSIRLRKKSKVYTVKLYSRLFMQYELIFLVASLVACGSSHSPPQPADSPPRENTIIMIVSQVLSLQKVVLI
jgi:hypothetical protein